MGPAKVRVRVRVRLRVRVGVRVRVRVRDRHLNISDPKTCNLSELGDGAWYSGLGLGLTYTQL